MNSNNHRKIVYYTRHCWRLDVDDNESMTLPKEAATCSEVLRYGEYSANRNKDKEIQWEFWFFRKIV